MGDPPAASSSRRTRHAKPHCPTPDYWQPKTLFRARPRSPVSRLGYLPRHPFQGPGWAWHQSAALLRIPSIGDTFQNNRSVALLSCSAFSLASHRWPAPPQLSATRTECKAVRQLHPSGMLFFRPASPRQPGAST